MNEKTSQRASGNERANEIGLLVIWRIKNYTCFCLSWLYRYHKVMLRRMQRELLVSQQGQKFILLHLNASIAGFRIPRGCADFGHISILSPHTKVG
jgi:hypothetical protein